MAAHSEHTKGVFDELTGVSANDVSGLSHSEHQLLRSFVPLNRLSNDHLDSLLRDTRPEYLCAGQVLFEAGECDNAHVYLLHGELDITDASGAPKTINAESMTGTFAIAHSQPRLATARAASDCCVIRFNSDRLDGIVAWEQIVSYILLDISSQRDLDNDAEWMATLLRSNLFYKVPPINIANILHRFEQLTVNAGDVILRQGEIGDCCYVIKQGSADVFRAPDERAPQERIARLEAGRCFGEDALINNALRNATIRMNTSGQLMRLSKQDFYLLLKEPEVINMNLPSASDALEQGAEWIDVRSQEEYEVGHCHGALHLPLDILQLKTRLLDPNKRYITYCNSGRRSQAAAYFLQSLGYQVSALAGGFRRYAVDESKRHLDMCF